MILIKNVRHDTYERYIQIKQIQL